LLSLLVTATQAQQIPGQPGFPPAPGAFPAQPGGTQAPAVAIVNGQIITTADLEAIVKLGSQSPVPIPEGVQRQIRMQTLGMMIDDMLMEQFLKGNAAPVQPAEVEAKLAEMSKGLQDQGKTLADFCRDTNQTEMQLRAGLARQMQWFAYANPRITEKEMRAHYGAYKDFYDHTMVRVSHIAIAVDAKATDAEKAQTRTKLEELSKQIMAGKISFADAAKANSQCPNAPKGGDIGFIPRKTLVDDNFARAAFALQPNQMSGVVQTDYGMHLILVTERKTGEPSTYETSKEFVRKYCIGDLAQSILAQQRKAAKIEITLP
jgi:peptidyl-prolyl cis-trans isomerase C